MSWFLGDDRDSNTNFTQQINLNAADVADVTACPFAAALLIAVIVATCFTLFAIMKKVFTITERMRLQDDIINVTLLATTMYNVYMFYSNLTASYLDDLPAFQAVASSMLNLSFLTLL